MSISVRYIVAAACCVAVLFAASLFLGSVPIPLRAVLGILTGGLTASAAGITAAVIFGLLASLIFKPKDK